MAKRLTSIRRVPTPDVQGDDSYVEIRALTYGKAQEFALMAKNATDDAAKEKIGRLLVVDHVIGWNWVDDDGKPLPTPAANPDVVNLLTTEEMTCLTKAINDGKAPKSEQPS